MNKLMLMKGKIMTFLILTCLVFAQSCKKDQSNETNLPDDTLSELKERYRNEKAKSGGKTETLPGLAPIWDKVSVSEDKGKLVYEIAVDNPNRVFTAQKEVEKSKLGEYENRSVFRLILIKDKSTGAIDGAYYMNIAAEAKNQDIQKVRYKKTIGFSGTIQYYNISGNFNVGWHYTNGNIDRKLNPFGKTDKGAKTESSVPCGTIPRYATFCFELEGGGQSCETKIVGFDTIECEVDFIKPEDPGAGGPQPGDGAGPTQPEKPTEQQLEDALENKPFAFFKDVSCETLKKWLATAKFKPGTPIIDKLNTLKNSSLDAFLFGKKIARIQSIDDAVSPVVNMDYFPVKIDQMPIVNGQRLSPDQFIHYLRTNLNSFTDGSKLFMPYNNNGIDDRAKWNSTDPEGSILALDISGPDNASVIVSKSTSSGWTFTTIYEPMYGEHPVSGNREFGYTTNQDGSYTFFARGVDRLTSVDGDFANVLPEFFGFSKGIPFWQADALWDSFKRGIRDFVGSHQGSATIQANEILRPQWNLVSDVIQGKQPLSTLSKNCPD